MFGWNIRKKIETKKVRTIRILFDTVEDACECLDVVVDWIDEMGISLICGDIKDLDELKCYATLTVFSTKLVYNMIEDLFYETKNRSKKSL